MTDQEKSGPGGQRGALWQKAARYSRRRVEELKARKDAYQRQAATFAGWVRQRLFLPGGGKGPAEEDIAQHRQGRLLHRIANYRLTRRQRTHQSGGTQPDREYGVRPWALARVLEWLRGQSGR